MLFVKRYAAEGEIYKGKNFHREVLADLSLYNILEKNSVKWEIDIDVVCPGWIFTINCFTRDSYNLFD